MKHLRLNGICALLLACILLVGFALPVSAASITTTPTGYTSPSDVVYKTSGGTILNWGARGEVATFLSPNAEKFYTGKYTYDVLSQKEGGTGKSDAYRSDLYFELKNLMTDRHTHKTSYGETRYEYQYTDCVSNNSAYISSFYSGKQLSGTWGSGWNREHTWPNSKGLGGSDEDDIMMLRPTWEAENFSRGNTAYGEGSAYFDPGRDVRGDCARICLYVYVRWGNTSYMWGTYGVMESVDILLKWMEEDPVDTWEMGRNDSVESITGTRNVFVDYPEYAFQLFSRDIPAGYTTPSQSDYVAPCNHTWGSWYTVKEPTFTEKGEANRVCYLCGEVDTKELPVKVCNHTYGAWKVMTAPTYQKEGVQIRTCSSCGNMERGTIPKLVCASHVFGAWQETPATYYADGERTRTCETCGHTERETLPKLVCGTHLFGAWQTDTPATYFASGEDSRVCENCGTKETRTIPQLVCETHRFGEWVITTPNTDTTPGMKEHICEQCGKKEAKTIPAQDACSHPDMEVTVLRPATEERGGMEQVKCPDCGYEGLRTTPPLINGADCATDPTATLACVTFAAFVFLCIKRKMFHK